MVADCLVERHLSLPVTAQTRDRSNQATGKKKIIADHVLSQLFNPKSYCYSNLGSMA